MNNEHGERSNLELLLKANEETRQLELTSASGDQDDPRALLHKSVDTKSAFGLFGLLLGILPPAAIYGRIVLSDAVFVTMPALPMLFVISLVICALVGRWLAAWLSWSFDIRRCSGFTRSLINLMLLGILWGLLTGGLGGLVVYGFGGIFGAIIASVTAALTFPLFTLFYNALSRGGMIETRQLLPIAVGIPAIVAAFILGL